MSDSRSDDPPDDDTERPWHDPEEFQMTTSSSPSLRTDRNQLGLLIALVLAVVAVAVHVSADHTTFVTAVVLALAVLIAAISIPYDTFRDRE
ncbi:hypothetical protein [Natronorubrum sulfidifaciens]|uniref:Uncharacterized protein n=1 Tax=Natronorubrum sulfidifaciens JCM 14089 TaxID=1230460 RepID=L9WCA0_9EURY|nr:hypothetical protein [Natronorubrum sulfidifaciens]ELY46906.1 hypothetical protein C495_05578 [Natronorubrum sulfidifaciens JCM 14089]